MICHMFDFEAVCRLLVNEALTLNLTSLLHSSVDRDRFPPDDYAQPLRLAVKQSPISAALVSVAWNPSQISCDEPVVP